MKAMVWFLGVFMILLGFEVRSSNAWQWAAVWGSSAAFWFLVGCIVAVYGVAKKAFDKSRAAATEALKGRLASPPAQKKEA